MQECAKSSFWEERYLNGTTGWDLGLASPPLASLLESPEAPPPGRAAVLGCGRGYDAILFASREFDVVGFDFAPSAISASTRLAEAASLNTPLKVEFLQRDIFDLPGEFAGEFDYVVEHTCFCAIPPAKRETYVRMVHSILRPDGELIGMFFSGDRPNQPPFGATPAEIEDYFAPYFEIVFIAPVTNSVPRREGEELLGRFRRKEIRV